jgi:uncharacterized YigZ family protein
MPDSFHTLKETTQSELREKGSKFIGIAFPMRTVEEFELQYDPIKKDHSKANHHCYAWRLEENLHRNNDDGEPSGTAGRPIQGQLESFNLYQVGIIVIRYFGGTLLGTSGLIHAYRDTARAALDKATIVEKILEEIIEISFEYHKMGDVMRSIDKLKPKLLSAKHEDLGYLEISTPKKETQSFILKFKCLAGQFFPEEVNLNTSIEGIYINVKS